MYRLPHPRRTLTAAGIALALTLTACAGTDSGAPTASTSTSTSTSTSDSPTTAAAAAHNDADMVFVTGMIPHHEGAIAMAALAPDRAAAPSVKQLAAQIQAAQQPEIDEMTSWLDAWGASMSGGMDMGTSGADMHMGTSAMHMGATTGTGMDGMMSDQDMAALTAATGADFDRLFLELMIVHHQGAIGMADIEIGTGAAPEALALAESIRSGQTAEIATMRELLAGM